MTLNFCLCVFEQKAKAKPTVTISNEYGSSFEKEQQPSNYRGTNFTPRLTQLTQWSIWLKIKGRKMHFNFTILFSFVQYFFVLNPGGMLLLFFTGVYGLWCSSRVEPNRKINKFKWIVTIVAKRYDIQRFLNSIFMRYIVPTKLNDKQRKLILHDGSFQP